jgi:branched-chain amino acid aminotransferase
MMDLPKNAYFQGKFVPYSEAKVGVMTHGLNYGTAAFAGIRAYWNDEEEQLFLFRAADHYRRFLNSTKLLRMDFGHTPESLVQITLELLRIDDYHTDIYIRPLAYKADEIIGVKLHGLRSELSIVALPYAQYMANDTNAHVTISSWHAARLPELMPTRLLSSRMPSWRVLTKPWCSPRKGTFPKARR